ncbi:hypothetical protein D6R50_05385 [Aeromonas veronii]|uniref:Uncharacterized protein n=1 Tax=Aeromonas veronii TaxID=654 RepID=A0A3A9IMB7_AERVE|nr:hypothetical protein D6R50_05385 [Aeromonas veronii]
MGLGGALGKQGRPALLTMEGGEMMKTNWMLGRRGILTSYRANQVSKRAGVLSVLRLELTKPAWPSNDGQAGRLL